VIAAERSHVSKAYCPFVGVTLLDCSSVHTGTCASSYATFLSFSATPL
jgi:hypothetical protein